MAKHTDFGRLGGSEDPARRLRRDARAALFTDAPASDEAELRSEEPELPRETARGQAASRPPRPAERDGVGAAQAVPMSTRASEPGTAGQGWFVIDCATCGDESATGLLGLVRAAIPSVHLPMLKRDHPSLMRCPRCRAHRWVSVRVRPPG